MTHRSIPEEQRAKLQPGVDDLLAKIRALARELPENSESALVFHPDAEDPE